MKISIILPDHAKRIYGGYVVVFTYANYLVNNGHEVSIYYMMQEFMSRKKVPSILQRGVSAYAVRCYPKWFKLDSRIKKYGILAGDKVSCGDLLIATEIRTVNFVMEQDLLCGKKVHFIQGHEIWESDEGYVTTAYSFDMHNIVVAQWLKAIVDKYSKEPAVCIQNGVNSNVFFIDHNEKRNEYSIVFHYRSASYKGGDVAIAVVNKLMKRFTNLVVDVITSEAKLPILPCCCKGHINISQKEVAEINNRAKVFLCTSREEGYGLPGLEAMACGCALVSTKYKGVLEYASNYSEENDNGNSCLVDVDDINGLVNAIADIFQRPERYKKMIKNGISTANELSSTNAAYKFEQELLKIKSNIK